MSGRAGSIAIRSQSTRLARVGEHAVVTEILDDGAAGAQHFRDVRGDRRLIARLRRDVDQLERSRREAVGQLGA